MLTYFVCITAILTAYPAIDMWNIHMFQGKLQKNTNIIPEITQKSHF